MGVAEARIGAKRVVVATRPAGNLEQRMRLLPRKVSDTSAPTSIIPLSRYRATWRPGRGRLAEQTNDQTSPHAAGTNLEKSFGSTRSRMTAVRVGSLFDTVTL